MKKVKLQIPEKLRKGIPLKTAPNHTVRLEVTDEALTVHSGGDQQGGGNQKNPWSFMVNEG